MILDKPKRRCETMVGTLWVDNSEKPSERLNRLGRAVKEIGNKFGMDGKVTGNYLADDRHLSLECSVTITAVIHREPLESRWARALDMIREQYGLEIEWKRGEVRERTAKRSAAWLTHVTPFHEAYNPPKRVMYSPKSGKWEEVHNTVPPVEESFGAVNIEIGDDKVAKIDMPVVIYDEVSDEFYQEAYDRLKATALHVARGNSKHDLECALNDITGVEKVEIEEKPFEIFAKIYAPCGHDVRQEVGNVMKVMVGLGIKWDFEVEDCQTTPKSYASTPTGTVEWVEKKGRLIAYSLGNQDDPKEYHFRDALHLVHDEIDEMLIRCPVCGDNPGDGFYCDHVSDVLKNEESGNIDELETGITCTNCHTHLTYDFEAETVTMRRGE